MNNLIAQNESLTMTTKEIADLIHKNHSDIKRSALRLESNNLLTQPLAELDFMHKGNIYHMYKLNKRDSILLVAQNCPEFTAVLVDRWQELESRQAPVLPDFNNAVLMARTWADDQEAKQAQAKQLELQAPKVAFVDNCVERGQLMTATQVAQKHKMSAVKLNKFLDEIGGVYNKSVKRSRIFTQPFIAKEYGETKQTEQGYSQSLFTAKGEQWINEKLITEGVI